MAPDRWGVGPSPVPLSRLGVSVWFVEAGAVSVHRRSVWDRHATVALRKLLGSWTPPRRGEAKIRQSVVVNQLDELIRAFPARAVTIEIRRRVA